jgi:peroxiredoxin
MLTEVHVALKELSIGSTIPPFQDLPGVDGKNYGVSDFTSSRVLVVVFSCNHCPYVQAYEDRMKEFQSVYGPKGVRLVAINSNETVNYPEDSFDEMVKRARARGFNFPYLRDECQSVADAFGATHTPEFFVFAPKVGVRDYVLQYRGRMDDNYQQPAAVKRRYLQEAVDSILAGEPVVELETYSIGCTIKWKKP